MERQGDNALNRLNLRATALALLIPVLAAGCSTANTKPKPVPAPTYDQLMQQAAARFDAQDANGAKALYSKAAERDPTRPTPWYRLAQINFDQQNYGRAIVDAQEVLQRNPADTNAESILTIAGLRVAVEALGRLHDETNLQGPAHAEAEKLAAKMRETLGQDVLVPPATVPKRKPRRRPTAVADRPAEPAKAPAATAAPAGDNPFQSLPGGDL